MTRIALFALLISMLAGCVIETNDTMAKNKDTGKALKAYVQLGLRYVQDRNMTQADRVLRKAAAIDEDDASLNNAYGLFYLVENDIEKAESHFKKAIAEDPEFSGAYNNYGNLLFNNGRYAEAVEHLLVVSKHYRYERRYQVYETLGKCYVKLAQPEQAEQAYLKALQLYPRLPGTLLALGELYLDKGKYLLSKKYLDQFEASSKPSAQQLWLGIRLQQHLGDADKLASYELALRNLFPGSPQYREYQKLRENQPTVSP